MSSATNDLNEQLHKAILRWDKETAVKAAQSILDAGSDITKVIKNVIKPTADEIGQKFDQGEFFLPQMLMAGEALEAAMSILLAASPSSESQVRHSILIGTVKGDIHTIGKNTVGMMLRTGGFAVHDIGIDVDAATFVQAATEKQVDIIALSSMLTTTLPYQADVIEELEARGLRQQFKVMVGGGPASQEWANKIGADGYGKDAVEALAIARRLLDIEA